MARFYAALFTLLSLFSLDLRPLRAQSTSAARAEVVTVAPDETRDNLAVRDADVVISGHVLHDVLAIHSDVTLSPGASIGGSLVAVGGTVHDETGGKIHVVQQSAQVAAELDRTDQRLEDADDTHRANAAAHRLHKWNDGQTMLLAFGLLSALLLNIAAPRAANRTMSLMHGRTSRSLATGAIAGAALFVFVLLLGALLKSTAHTIVMPFVVAVLIAVLVVLSAGWLCGMRYTADLVAAKLGKPLHGRLYLRTAAGLFAFFVLNMLLGKLLSGGSGEKLAVVGMVLEVGVGLMGLGAFLTVLTSPAPAEDQMSSEGRFTGEIM